MNHSLSIMAKGKKSGHICIGTSGWSYPHWRGAFYPEDMPEAQMFDYYTGRFNTVEINNSFYQLPSVGTLAAWRKAAPDGFLFSMKASRYITHMKKLKDPKSSVKKFFATVDKLGSRLGPILFQLPPKWKPNMDRLGEFLEALPARHRYAFEFRDSRWFDDEVFDILVQHNAAFCIYHLAGFETPHHVTADFAYVRLHGPDDAYEGSYCNKTLKQWADSINSWASDGLDVYCYFDNDEAGHAPLNAQTLAGYCGQE